MDNDFFLNAGISPSLVHFETNPSIPTWQQLSSAMEIQASDLNCSSEQPLDCFLNSHWEKPVSDQSFQFDSALSSMGSSPAASNSNPSTESFVIRELIGKLGSIGNSPQLLGNSYANSPPRLNFLGNERLVKENLPTLCKPMALNSSVGEFSADPGFAERAARLSCFGSRSFNGRRSQAAASGDEFANYRSNHSIANEKLCRVSSSPSLKAVGSEMGLPENKNSSEEESTLSEQNPNVGKGLKASGDLTPRKRKAVAKGKVKEPSSSSPSTATRMAEANENSTPKRCKTAETNGNEKASVKTEEDSKKTDCNSGEEKQTKTNSKPPEPPKDYIHVRARRGQATDSHSLAERVRREKISERMKLLQDLVPGCNKVTGKALMLDEIINYVQSLQHQVEFLSMKLASVNTRMDFNMDSLISKEMYQPGNSMGHPQVSPIDSSASAFYGQQNSALPSSSYGNVRASSSSHCNPLDSVLCQNLGIQAPSLNGYGENGSQYPIFGEDDLQTIVQMGFVQNQNREIPPQSQNFNLGSEQVSHMKVEL